MTHHSAQLGLLCLLLVTLAAACADAGGADAAAPVELEGVGGQFTLWNRSQYTLLETRLHTDTTYTQAPNLLDEPVAPLDQVDLMLEKGQFVTIIRERALGDQLVAQTTAVGMALPEPGAVLLVFDDGFELITRQQAQQLSGFENP